MTAAAVGLIFARHGRTAWNLAGRYQGRSDPPLSPEGEADAETVARSLSEDRPVAIVASPSRRTMMTARIVGNRLGLSRIQVDGRLLEVAYGAWEGLTQAEIKARWPEQLRVWKRTPEAMQFPGGETLEQARARLRAFARESTALDDTGGPVLVVSHAGMIRLTILEARRAPLSDFRRVDVDHGGVHRFRLCRDVAAGRLSLSEMERNPCELP
jgi:probable phosphoglycerate mutase